MATSRCVRSREEIIEHRLPNSLYDDAVRELGSPNPPGRLPYLEDDILLARNSTGPDQSVLFPRGHLSSIRCEKPPSALELCKHRFGGRLGPTRSNTELLITERLQRFVHKSYGQVTEYLGPTYEARFDAAGNLMGFL